MRKLIKIEERANQIATEDLGLKFDTIEFDVVPKEKMFEIMSYQFIGQYSNWKFGRDFERVRTIYEKTGGGLPYEVVVNTNPVRAYLMKNNTLAIQALVLTHVIGHASFSYFNNNHVTADKDLTSKLIAASKRFEEYERKYGIDAVENIQDAGHAIMWHSTPNDSSETEEEKRKRIFEQEKRKAHERKSTEFDDFLGDEHYKKIQTERDLYNHNIWMKLKSRTPVEPTEDLLRYIIDNSKVLDNWEKDILEIIRMEGRFIHPMIKTKYMNEGFACITENSLVHTENGFVPIIQAEEYCNKVVGINGKLTDIQERYITKKIPTIKIKTNNGLELEGAELHRILVNENGIEKDVHLKDLKIGDDVCISIGTDIWPEEKVSINIDSCLQRQMFSISQKVELPNDIDEDIAYLMGLIISEGNMKERGITFTNQNNELLMEVQRIYREKFDKTVKISNKSDNPKTKVIQMYSTTILDFMNQAGVENLFSNKKEIPWSILQSPKSVVSAFIAGVFDGDGCVYYNGKSSRQIIFTSKSEKLIRQLSIILLNYGIYCDFSVNKKDRYDDCYQIRICRAKCIKIFEKEIPFKSVVKHLILKDAISSMKWEYDVPNIAKIVSIEHSEAINYDWHIPNGNHYVANGFINHNTWTHQKIMRKLFNEGYLSHTDHAEYNYSNSLVKRKDKYSMNPYHIGSVMWEDIEKRWNKGQYGEEWEECRSAIKKENWDTGEMNGLKKIHKVLRTYSDWMFMNDFLTTDLVRKLELYLYKNVKDFYAKRVVITDHEAEEIRQLIVKSFSHSGIPKVLIYNGNGHGRGVLIMKHHHIGPDLDKEYTEKTLNHIAHIWGNEVFLRTIVDKTPYTYKAKNPYDNDPNDK